MERLLKDAQAFSGVEYKIDNLADVYEAVHVVQEELGITGTTALEAEETISGSLNSMKSAFTNTLGKLALGEDIGPSLNDLAGTIKIFFVDNLFPMVGTILKALPGSIKTFIAAITPGLKQAGKDLLSKIFGEETTEVITKMLDKAEDLTKNGIGKLIDAFQFLKDKADILIPVLAGVVGGFVAFKIITGINKGMATMQGLMILLKGSTVAQTFAQGGLNAVMAANPIAMVVIAIGLLIGIGVALWKNWDVVKAKAEELWKKMKETGTKVKESFEDMKKKVIEFVSTMVTDSITKFINFKDNAIQKTKDLFTGVIKWVKDTKDKAIEWFGKLATDGVQKIVDLKDGVIRWISNMATNTVDGVRNLKRDVVKWFDGMKTDAIQKAKDMIDYIKAMPGKMADGIRNGAGALQNQFKKMWNGVVSVIKTPVNAVIGGANWILDKFGAKKIDLWPATNYAKGTDGHMGGPALVNDQKGGVYREAIQTPDGETFIPKGRNVLFPNMPKGTKVMPAGETKKVMAYKSGVGSWIKDKALGLWNWAKKPFDLVKNVLKDHIGFGGATRSVLDMGKGMVKTVTNPMAEWVKGLFKSNENPEEGGMGSGIMGGLGFKGFRKSSPFGYRTHPTLGYRKLHTGVDLAAPAGTNVFAQHAGKVLSSGWAGSFGKMVKIGSGGFEQLYAHLSQNIAKLGTMVKQGQLIGKVGSTGRSTGPHLHYEVRKNGRPVYPGYKGGTRNHPGGLSWVGEDGPELENRPSGTQVYSNSESNDIVSLLQMLIEEVRKGHVININGRTIASVVASDMNKSLRTNSNEDNIGRGVLV